MSENKKINLEVNNQRYDGFINITITRSLDNAYGTFNFIATSNKDSPFIVPFKNGEHCKVWILDNIIIDGYIERISVNYSANSHVISIQGRDRLADFTDSSTIGNMDFKVPISLPSVLRNVLDSLGLSDIEVINQAGLELDTDYFEKGEDLACDVGTNAFEFIKKLCLKKQVLLIGDGKGNIILTRAENKKITTFIRNYTGRENSNILNCSINFDNSQRYFAYVCRSQGNLSNGLSDVSSDSKRGITYDTGIRQTRTLEFQAESLSSIDSCQKRAEFEANVRRAKSQAVSYTMKGFFIDAFEVEGVFANLWEINKLVKVEDTFLDINSEMLINSVVYSYGLDTGETTMLELLPPDAYTLQASEDKKQSLVDKVALEIKQGITYSPDTWEATVKGFGVDL